MRNKKVIDVRDTSAPGVLTGFVSVIISSVLCIGLTLMLTSAFRLNIKPVPVIAWTVMLSAIFTVIHCLNKKKLSVAVMTAVPVLLVLVFVFDAFGSQDSLNAFLYYVQNNIVYTIPGEYAAPSSIKDPIFMLLMHFNMIPLCITTFTLTNRKFIPVSLLAFSPLFVFSVANVIMIPGQAAVICAATGVLALFCAHAFRAKSRKSSEKALLIMMIPSFVFPLVLGLIFPLDKYNKDNLAKNILIETKNIISQIPFDADNEVITLIDTATNGLQDPEWLNDQISSSQLTALYPSVKNLNKVGPFNPSTGRIMEVRKDQNNLYNGAYEFYDGPNLYIRVESLDTYKDNMLSRSYFPSQVYKDNIELPEYQGQYSITITPLETATTDITPYYSDLYFMYGIEPGTYGLYTTTSSENESYASSPVPIKAGDVYSDKYIENYVYGTNLEVPERTRDAITMSGKLPDWYIDCLYGRSTMSDCDKVRAVTEFVRNLHPYNTATDYPPDNVDFVPWFIQDARSGICVHYATTTVILLRMIGIPARYVCGFAYNRAYNNYTSYVFAEEAHAWFEFFVPGYGWIMGDATPGMAGMAAPFDINGVSEAYPEIENEVFSRNRSNITDHIPQAATPTPAEETTETTPPTDETDPTEVIESDETEPTEETEPSAKTEYSDQTTPSDPSTDQSDAVKETLEPGETSDFSADDTDSAVVHFVLNPELARNIAIVFFSILGFAVLLILIRLGYVMYWRYKFSAKKPGDKIIAYYHYYKFIHNFMRKNLPSKAIAIVDKAAFSQEIITKTDVNILIRTCEKSMSIYTRRLPRFKRLILRSIVVKNGTYK